MLNSMEEIRESDKMNKTLAAGLIIALVMVAITAVSLYLFWPGDKVCMTQQCVIEAANLIKYMDKSVDPCDDFFDFACGKWIRDTPLPDDKAALNQYGILKDQLDNRLTGLISRIDQDKEERNFVRNVKRFYDSCYNTSLLQQLEGKPLWNLLDRLGGWPLVHRELWKEVRWDDLVLKLREEGLTSSVLFRMSILVDPKDNTRRILYVDSPSFGLGSRESVLKGPADPIVKAYKKLMYNTAIKLGGSSPERVNNNVESLYAFEERLAENSMPQEERRNWTRLYNKLTVRQLKNSAPSINWIKLFTGVIDRTITENDEVVVHDMKFIKYLNDNIAKYPNDFLANLIIWRVILPSMTWLNDDWYKMKEEFDSVKYGTKGRSPRSEICTNVPYMRMALAYLYITNFFDNSNKEKAYDTLSNVFRVVRSELTENKWMAEQTRDNALRKVDKMKLLVGYPSELAIASKVEEHFWKLNLANDDYFGNQMRLTKWYNEYSLAKYRQPVEKFDWRDVSFMASVNAYHFWQQNMVVIPAGILQGVFFDKNRPKYEIRVNTDCTQLSSTNSYLNYGAIGTTVGHEVIHGFDDRGRQYDSEGTLRNWWDESTDSVYQSKSRCFIRQYSKFVVRETGQTVNGINTQGENIADNGGQVMAYRAYLEHVKQNGTEPKLPGLPYTPEQLFWISSAVKRCSKWRTETLRLQVLNGVHSPDRFRINGVAINSPDFAVAFNCPVDSPMNPKDKCKIW